MSNEEYVPDEERHTERWRDVLIRDRWRLFGIVLAAGGAAFFLGWQPTLPRWAKLFAVTAGVGAFIGYPAATRIVAWLYSPRFVYLLELDARSNETALWELPPAAWRDLEVTEGDLYEVRATAPMWHCLEYDPAENTAVGTWRGSKSDLELIEDRERIDEIRGVLEDLAKEGLTMRVKQSGIVRTAVRGVVNQFVSDFEEVAVYEGEEIEDAVEKALERWNLEDDAEPEESPEPGDDATDAEVNVAANGEGEPEATPDA